MQVNQNRCDATVMRFLSNNTCKGILNKLKAGQILSIDVPARRELQQSRREPTIAEATVFAASVVSEDRSIYKSEV